MYNNQQVRKLHDLRTKERPGVAKLRELLEDRLQEIKKAKTWKHERVLASPQDTKVTKIKSQVHVMNFLLK